MENTKKEDQKTQPIIKAAATNAVEAAPAGIAKLVSSWSSFKPEVPLSYSIASRNAARTKNS